MRRLAAILWAAYAGFIVYAAAIPFHFDLSRASLLAKLGQAQRIPFIDNAGGLASLPDMVQNVALFLPFGMLAVWSLGRGRASGSRVAAAALSALALSTAVEALQLLAPGRITSATDMATNTLGGLLGAALGLAVAHALPKLLRKGPSDLPARPDFHALVFFSLLAVLGAAEPFDFTLDVGQVFGGLKGLLRDPLGLSLPRDEVLAMLRFCLMALFARRLLEAKGTALPALSAAAAVAAAGAALEGMQLIIASRGPTLQDILYAAAGAVLGAALGRPAAPMGGPAAGEPFLSGPRLALLGLLFLAGLLLWSLHPFEPASAPRAMNWLPFRPHYERTGFAALGDFLQSMFTYAPLGFMALWMGRAGRDLSEPAWSGLASTAAAAATALVLSLCLEMGQGFVAGRYPDVTETVGALLGTLAGAWAAGPGWLAYRELAEAAHSSA